MTALIVFGIILVVTIIFFLLPDPIVKIPIAYNGFRTSSPLSSFPKFRTMHITDFSRVIPSYVVGFEKRGKILKRFVTQGSLEGLPSGTYLWTSSLFPDLFQIPLGSFVVLRLGEGKSERFIVGIFEKENRRGNFREAVVKVRRNGSYVLESFLWEMLVGKVIFKSSGNIV